MAGHNYGPSWPLSPYSYMWPSGDQSSYAARLGLGRPLRCLGGMQERFLPASQGRGLPTTLGSITEYMFTAIPIGTITVSLRRLDPMYE